MTIPLEKEPDDFKKHFYGAVERCFFCGEETLFWHVNTNNPVCVECSKKYKVAELPDFGKEVRKRKRNRSLL